jgi:hypothetical protein
VHFEGLCCSPLSRLCTQTKHYPTLQPSHPQHPHLQPQPCFSHSANFIKVLSKGRPEDGLPGISGRQVPLAEGQNVIPGLLNSQGSKVECRVEGGGKGQGTGVSGWRSG